MKVLGTQRVLLEARRTVVVTPAKEKNAAEGRARRKGGGRAVEETGGGRERGRGGWRAEQH